VRGRRGRRGARRAQAQFAGGRFICRRTGLSNEGWRTWKVTGGVTQGATPGSPLIDTRAV
jgi:hypothetical protein